MTKLKIWNKEFGILDFNGKPVVSSRTLADVFEKRHDHVMRDIESAIENFSKIDLPKFGEINLIKSNYIDKQNRQYSEYLLTKDGFAYIAMGFSGKKAAKFKIDYINKFNEMEQFISDLNTARLEFPELTQAILEVHETPKHYHFSNEMDMINRIVVGMTAKKFKEVNGLTNVKSIRPYLQVEQIYLIGMLQKTDIGLVLTEPEFQKRKRTLEWYCAKLKQKLLVA